MKCIHKNGQSEMMGLIMVIVLLSFGLIIYLVFAVLTPDRDIGEEYLIQQKAAYTNKALLDTTTTCRSISVSSLLEDCMTYKRLSCSGVSSCDFLFDGEDGAITQMLNATFDKWGRVYQYKVEMQNDNTNSHILENGNCSRRHDFIVNAQPLVTDAGVMYITLGVCS